MSRNRLSVKHVCRLSPRRLLDHCTTEPNPATRDLSSRFLSSGRSGTSLPSASLMPVLGLGLWFKGTREWHSDCAGLVVWLKKNKKREPGLFQKRTKNKKREPKLIKEKRKKKRSGTVRTQNTNLWTTSSSTILFLSEHLYSTLYFF